MQEWFNCVVWLVCHMLSALRQVMVEGVVAGARKVTPDRRYLPEDFTRAAIWVGVPFFSVLFATWGIVYGLLDIMNYHVKVEMGITRLRGSMMALAYYSGYFWVPTLVAGPAIKRLGYRPCVVVALCVLAVGMFLISKGAEMLSFGIMVFGNQVVGIAIAGLERVANSYALACGPRRTAPFRILLCQSFAAIGTIIAPIIANKFIMAETGSVRPEIDLIHPGKCLPPPDAALVTIDKATMARHLAPVFSFYRALGLVTFGMAFIYAVVFLLSGKVILEPVITSTPKSDRKWHKVHRHPLISVKFSRLWTGALANFLNLGCQVCVAQFFIETMQVNRCTTAAEGNQSFMHAQTAFAIGRLIAAALAVLGEKVKLFRWLKARVILSCFLALVVVAAGGNISATESLALVTALATMFFESPSFPMVFEQATAGLGQYESIGEDIMITSIGGGGIWPVAMGATTDAVGINKAWALPTALFGLVFCWTLASNIVPSWRHAIDGAHHEEGDKLVDSEAALSANIGPSSTVVEAKQITSRAE